MAQTIRIRCPHCRAVLQADIAHAGRTAACPACHRRMSIPQPSTARPPAPPPAPPTTDQALPTVDVEPTRMPVPTAVPQPPAPPPAVVSCSRCRQQMEVDWTLQNRLLECPRCGWRFALGYTTTAWGQACYWAFPASDWAPPRRDPPYAAAALVMGLLGIVLPWIGMIFAVVGIALGVISRQHWRRGGDRYNPSGMAVAGIVTGATGLTLWIVILLVVAATQS